MHHCWYPQQEANAWIQYRICLVYLLYPDHRAIPGDEVGSIKKEEMITNTSTRMGRSIRAWLDPVHLNVDHPENLPLKA